MRNWAVLVLKYLGDFGSDFVFMVQLGDADLWVYCLLLKAHYRICLSFFDPLLIF